MKTSPSRVCTVWMSPSSGDSSKMDRADIMKRLAEGRLGMVVTTELAARGLDVPYLTHVINLELPTSLEAYVHRAGRCGRAGRPGVVVTLTTPEKAFVVERWAKEGVMDITRVEPHRGRLVVYFEEDVKKIW